MAVVPPPPEKSPEERRDEQLRQYLAELKALKSRFKAAIDCIPVSPEGKPSEIMRGVCDKAGMLEEQAIVLITACTEAANQTPAAVSPKD